MAKPVTQNMINRSARISARTSREVQRLATRLDTRYEQTPVLQNAVTAGRNQVQIGGNYYPAEGIDGQGAAVAVVNVGSPAVARYAPSNTRSVVSVGGTGRAGGGGSSSGPTYVAGDGIVIDGSYEISVKLDASGAIIVGGGGLKVNVGDGIQIATNALTLNLATNPGLEYGSGGDAGKVQIKVGNGLTRDATGVLVNLATDPGLEFATGAMRVKAYYGITRDGNGIGVKLKTTSGLVVDTNGLAVGEGDGIDVLTNSVAVDVTDIIDTAYGLTESANNIRINKPTDSGLAFNGSGQLTLGTPSNVSLTSVNSLSGMGVSHSHFVVTSNDVGTSPAASILASNASGQLTLAQLTLYGNLVFAGGSRSITASNNLTISPSTDLILDPSGLITMPNAQEFRTSTINDLPTGIDGIRFWNRYANYNQLTIGAIKADELYVRVFVADETRIDRGEEYWSKSFGVVQEDFTLPDVGLTVNVWFEDAPGMSGFDLFSNGDYLLCRTIDWGTGLVVQKIWFQVTAAKLDQETTDVDGVDRQQWELTRIQGGIDDSLIKRGNLMLDAGVVGQGWVHLSALEQDGGPFIQVGEMTSVSTVPQFTNYVRMGNLNGTVDYSSDTFGFAAGSGSGGLGTAPSAGFSGLAAEATNGLRVFNAKILFYDASDLVIQLDDEAGLNFEMDTDAIANAARNIGWGFDIESGITSNNVPVNFGAYTDASAVDTRAIWSIWRNDATPAAMGKPTVTIRVIDDKTGATDSGLTELRLAPGSFKLLTASEVVYGQIYKSGRAGFGLNLATPASTGHFYQDDAAVSTAAGVTIEQDGTGDAVVQWLLTGGQRWMAGIDNSVSGDPFVISPNGNLSSSPALAILASGYVGINTVTPATNFHVAGLALIERTTSSNNGFAAAHLIESTSTGNMIDGFGTGMQFRIKDTAGVDNIIGIIGARRNGADNSGDIVLTPYASGTEAPSTRITTAGRLGVRINTPASTGHFYQNDSETGTAAGVTIEQDGTGDAVVQWLLTGVRRWVMGVDNSDSDKFKISPNTDVGSSPAITITTGLAVSFGGAVFTDSSLDVGSDLTIGDDIIVGDDANIGGNALVDGRIGVGGVISPGAWIDLSADVGGIPLMRSTNYGTSQYHFLGRTANGTAVSPTQAVNGTNLMSLGGLSYTSSGWASGAGAEISFQATQSHTSSARGTKILFYVTKNSTTSAAIALDLGNDREFYAPGVDAHTTAAAANVNVETSSGWLRRSTSSRRYKTDIRTMPSYGALFDSLTPIVYKPIEGVGGGQRDFPGLIAEDVLAAGGKDFVTFGDDGRVEYVMYDRLVVLTIAEVQAMKREIADLKERINRR